MSQLSEFSVAFRAFSQRPEMGEIDVLHRRSFTVYHILQQTGGLEKFSLGLPFYDKLEDMLYITIKPSLNAAAADCIFLTADDLNHLQTSINALRNREVDEPYKSFNDRLERFVGQALQEMRGHEKTVEWLKAGASTVTEPEKGKKTLLLSACTL